MMTPRRFATLAACGTVFAVWAVAGLADFDTPGAENTGAAPIADGRATSIIGYAAPVNAPQATAMDNVSGTDGASAELARRVAGAAARRTTRAGGDVEHA
jgi:hypothetical protein